MKTQHKRVRNEVAHAYGSRERKPDDPSPVDSQSPDKEVKVSTGGPWRRAQQYQLPEYSAGWNAGDIDFKDDGSIFIRNPYLADAIENHLMKNWANRENRFLLKIVRDEGWSGCPTNIVC